MKYHSTPYFPLRNIMKNAETIIIFIIITIIIIIIIIKRYLFSVNTNIKWYK